MCTGGSRNEPAPSNRRVELYAVVEIQKDACPLLAILVSYRLDTVRVEDEVSADISAVVLMPVSRFERTR